MLNLFTEILISNCSIFLIELSDKSNLKLNDISPLYESNYFNLTIK